MLVRGSGVGVAHRGEADDLGGVAEDQLGDAAMKSRAVCCSPRSSASV